MSRISSEDQLNFVLRCVKHSVNGKVDFGAVAEECGIVSKGAAAKRYERLLKTANDNPGTPSGDANSTASPAETPKKGGAKAKPKTPVKTPTKAKAAAKTDTTKKRKNGKASVPATPSKKVKSEENVQDSASDGVEVKQEMAGDAGSADSPLRSGNDPFLSQAPRETEYDTLFKEFCNTGASARDTVVVVKKENGGMHDDEGSDIPLAVLRAQDDFQA